MNSSTIVTPDKIFSNIAEFNSNSVAALDELLDHAAQLNVADSTDESIAALQTIASTLGEYRRVFHRFILPIHDQIRALQSELLNQKKKEKP